MRAENGVHPAGNWVSRRCFAYLSALGEDVFRALTGSEVAGETSCDARSAAGRRLNTMGYILVEAWNSSAASEGHFAGVWRTPSQPQRRTPW